VAQIRANDITIEYEDYGDASAPPVVLIMGLGAQLVRWPIELVDDLVARGYRVIRFDNRDVGLSSKFDHAGTPNIVWTAMIAQLVAASWPDRTLSLTSIMSTTGRSDCSRPTMRATAVLLRHPRTDDLEAIVAHGTLAANVVGGRFPMEDAFLAERIRSETLRNRHPAGFVRQMAAIIADGDRSKRLARITAPTLVIHGSDDPLVPVSGGRETARAIPGARLLEIDGMGHTLPPQVLPQIVDAIDAHASGASLGHDMAHAA
jgi:pimeloyl-ACP methyl ester carboxylesterase